MREKNCQSNIVESYLKGTTAHPQFSVDWRFLPGLPGEGKCLIVADVQDGFALPLSASYSPLVIQRQQRGQPAQPSMESLNPFSDRYVCLEADLLQNPFKPASFDLVAIPYGFPGGQNKAGRKLQLAYSRAAYRLTRPGGALFIGFANRWNFQRIYSDRFRGKPGSSISGISRLLKSVGYTSMTFYGAIQDHKNPIYIFPLQMNTVGFVVHRHYGRKLPGFLANASSKRFSSLGFRYLLPSYVVVAKTNGID